jgi:hypothetical protein
MFELRCSEFELFCSESEGKPPGSRSDLIAHHGAPLNMKIGSSGERVSLWVLCAVFRRLRINNPNICCSAQPKTLDDSRLESAAFSAPPTELAKWSGISGCHGR